MDSTSVHQCGGKSGKHTMFTANCFFLSVWSAEGPNPCELAQSPRYRKGPDVCFDNNENVRDKRVLYIALCGEFIFSKNTYISDITQSCPVSLIYMLLYFHLNAHSFLGGVLLLFVFVCLASSHRLSFLFCDFAYQGWATVSSQSGFHSHLYTSSFVSVSDFRVSFITKLYWGQFSQSS